MQIGLEADHMDKFLCLSNCISSWLLDIMDRIWFNVLVPQPLSYNFQSKSRYSQSFVYHNQRKQQFMIQFRNNFRLSYRRQFGNNDSQTFLGQKFLKCWSNGQKCPQKKLLEKAFLPSQINSQLSTLRTRLFRRRDIVGSPVHDKPLHFQVYYRREIQIKLREDVVCYIRQCQLGFFFS